MSASVSVIIPSYNHARYVCQTIESVLAQTLPPHEIIVVDDGSTDNTSEIVAPLLDRIHYVRHANCGVAATRNAGARLASGDYLTFIDADDLWLPQKLELQVARFEADPKLGLVHCGLEEITATGEFICRRLDGMEGHVANEMLLWRRVTILGGGSTLMVPREVFDRFGGFDENLSTSADWDFCYRVARAHEVGFVPEVLLRYRLHPNNMHGNVRLTERDMMIVYAKAFSEARSSKDSAVLRIRRRSYANLHTVLAGSYFASGQYLNFARHAFKGLSMGPDNLSRFRGFWIHWWRRRHAGSRRTDKGK